MPAATRTKKRKPQSIATSAPSSELGTRLYASMFTIRTAEEAIIKYYPEDEMKTPMHMSMGEEHIAAGVTAAIGPTGQIFASYRSHAAYIARTDDTDRFFLELYGKRGGTADGRAGSMHLAWPERGHMVASAIVASCIPPAVGAAYANKMQKTGAISSVLFGDGALDEGAFWESLNVACSMKLPVLFVCEDNGLAVHTPTQARQGYRSIEDVASRFECNVFSYDSTDVEKVHETVKKAVDAIRATSKPSFVRLRWYRYLEHVGIAEDFSAGYRPRAEFETWRAKDPVATQRARLLKAGVSKTEIAALETKIRKQVEQSVARARAARFPEPADLHRGVFYAAD